MIPLLGECILGVLTDGEGIWFGCSSGVGGNFDPADDGEGRLGGGELNLASRPGLAMVTE